MKKLTPLKRNLLKPVFVVLWPVVVPMNILSDFIGSITGNRNGVGFNHSTGDITQAPNKLSWIDQLGNEVWGLNDLNEDYLPKK